MSSQHPRIEKIHRPPDESEYAQVRAEDIVIQFGVASTGEWREPARDKYQILIILEPECEAEIICRSAGGKQTRRQIHEASICTVEKQTAFTMRWMRPTAFVSLLVSENFVERNGGHAAMSGVTVKSEFEYACADIDISDYDKRLSKLCRDPTSLSPDHICGLGLIQASRIILARSRPPLVKRPRILSAEEMAKIDNHIKEHILEQIRLEKAAQFSGVGKDQFSRIFKRTTGKRFRQYVLHFRVKFAQRLLSKGDKRKGEAADAAGFSDQPHYRRTVRELCENTQ